MHPPRGRARPGQSVSAPAVTAHRRLRAAAIDECGGVRQPSSRRHNDLSPDLPRAHRGELRR
jgi:hypothetical protein